VKDDADFILNVFNTLNGLYKNQNFVLLAVVERDKLTNELRRIRRKRLLIDGVEYFSSDDDAGTGGDEAGWIRLIRSALNS
jgi:hypothetical protein